MRNFLAVAVLSGVAACATGTPDVQPVDIPRLEQELAASPDDTGLRVQLGMAQFKAGEFEAARGNLSSAVEAGDESGAGYLYLGMANEELEDWAAAREAYSRYLEVGASTETRAEVRKRLTLIGRSLLRAQAQQALAQEQEITATARVAPRSVAVLPLAFNSDREDLEPLIYALSDMMITDLKVSNALTVLERAQIQILLDEMALTSTGYADSQTGARAGRLLRAEHVFQGVLTTLGGEDLQTDADILNVPSTSSAGQLAASAILEDLFDMEKELVIRTIREVLGVELTPAEEQAILGNRMSNVMAFLAFGRGLREMDMGNYEAAMAEFETMTSLESGGYDGADAAIAEVAALIDAASMNTTDLAGIASATGETGSVLFGPPPASVTADLSDLGIVNPAPVGAASSPEALTAGEAPSGTAGVPGDPNDPAAGDVPVDAAGNPIDPSDPAAGDVPVDAAGNPIDPNDPAAGDVPVDAAGNPIDPNDPAVGDVPVDAAGNPIDPDDPGTGEVPVDTQGDPNVPGGGQTTTTVGTSTTLTNVTEGVDPTPTTGTIDLGSGPQSNDPTPEQTKPTTREPVQEAQGTETIPGTGEALIRIIIRRPGGEQ